MQNNIFFIIVRMLSIFGLVLSNIFSCMIRIILNIVNSINFITKLWRLTIEIGSDTFTRSWAYIYPSENVGMWTKF